MCLFHHDPDHSDERILAMEMQARELAAQAGASMRIDAAREGFEILLTLERS